VDQEFSDVYGYLQILERPIEEAGISSKESKRAGQGVLHAFDIHSKG